MPIGDLHEGAYGEDCGSCHVPRDWLIWEFDHRAQTRFALEGAHAQAACKVMPCAGRTTANGRLRQLPPR